MAVAHQGAISFGLVHIPISLYRTTVDTDISFNQLCKQTHERVKYKKFCSGCEKELTSKDIIKGYQYEKDRYVLINDDEIEALKVEKDRTIHILHFTPISNINDVYFEKNYYAIPQKNAEKAYELLRSAMAAQKVVAVAKSVIGTKETLLALSPMDNGILVKTLYYEDEIADVPKEIKKVKLTKAENDMAKQLVKSMTQEFDPSLYKDEFQEKLRALIEAKIEGNDITTNNQEIKTETPVDLMEALQQSIMAMNNTTQELRH